jgi:hypothetical protein
VQHPTDLNGSRMWPSRRRLLTLGMSALTSPAIASVRFDPLAAGMVQTLTEDFSGPPGSWWQDNGGKFSPTIRYFSASPNPIHPLGQDAQFFTAREKQVFTWEGDPNNLGVRLFRKHPDKDSGIRMQARRAGKDYPNALRPWLAPCLESSNGAIWLRPHSNPYAMGDGRGHEQRCGYWEVRCTLPQTAGTLLWPAWWLYGAAGAEIDIFERVGREFTTNARYHPDRGALEPWSLPFDPSDYHTWGVLWTPDSITFFCDRVPHRSIPTSPRYDFFGPLYMVLSLGVGGDWPENPPNSGTDAATPDEPYMDVDYIRVWQFRRFLG